MVESNLSLGIVGVGRRGAELIRCFDALEGCTVSKICDSSLSQLMFVREWFPHIPVTANYDDLLHDGTIQAIVIATPAQSRYVQAQASLRAGKHVLIEPPATLDSRQANDLVDVAANMDRIMGVGHTIVYQPVVSEVQSLLALGQVGQLCYMASERSKLGSADTELNVIWDLAMQDVAVALYLAREPAVAVTAAGQNFVHNKLVDAASIRISYESGRFSQHSVSWLPTEFRQRFLVAGSEGSIHFERIGDMDKLFISGHEVDLGNIQADLSQQEGSRSMEMTPSPKAGNPSALTLECTNFLDSVLFHEKPCASAQLGRDVVKVLEAADRSICQASVPIQLN